MPSTPVSCIVVIIVIVVVVVDRGKLDALDTSVMYCWSWN